MHPFCPLLHLSRNASLFFRSPQRIGGINPLRWRRWRTAFLRETCLHAASCEDQMRNSKSRTTQISSLEISGSHAEQRGDRKWRLLIVNELRRRSVMSPPEVAVSAF